MVNKSGEVFQPRVQKLMVQINGIKPAGQSPDHKTRFIITAEGVNMELEEVAFDTLFEPFVVERLKVKEEVKEKTKKAIKRTVKK